MMDWLFSKPKTVTADFEKIYQEYLAGGSAEEMKDSLHGSCPEGLDGVGWYLIRITLFLFKKVADIERGNAQS